MVAVNPQIFKFLEMLRKCEIANSTITPRFDESNSCHSSTATHCRFSKNLVLDFCARSKCKLSGVTTKISGMFLVCFCFSDAEMSPFLTPTVQSNPISSMEVCIAFAMSLESERSGVIQSSCNLDKSRLVLTFSG